MYRTFGAPSGALGGSNGAQSGSESRISTLIVPLNGFFPITKPPSPDHQNVESAACVSRPPAQSAGTPNHFSVVSGGDDLLKVRGASDVREGNCLRTVGTPTLRARGGEVSSGLEAEVAENLLDVGDRALCHEQGLGARWIQAENPRAAS